MRGKAEPRKGVREQGRSRVDEVRPPLRVASTPSPIRTRTRAPVDGIRRAPDWLEPALLATLHAIPSAAMIVDRLGNVVLANQAGRDFAATLEAADLVARVEAARQGIGATLTITELAPGRRGPVLAVRNVDEPSLMVLLKRAAEQFALTKAQTRVLAQIARGHANRGIASELGISERTVEAHVTAILEKLGVDCRAAAVAAALGNPDAIAPGPERSDVPASSPPAPASRTRRTA